ncbi:MAG: gamma carbonic anhydrase family protein [Candidatus Thorarchaeota archaeon]
MPIYEFEGRTPSIGGGTYVSPSACIVGKVSLGTECYVAPGAVVKGDYGEIRVGSGTSIQDNVIIHARPGQTTVIGNNVTLGHGCIIHNATVEDDAVIGMGAIVSDYAVIGRGAVIGEGAVVSARSAIPSSKVAVGVPARVVGDVQERHRSEFEEFKKIYRDLARRYASGLRQVG